MDSKTTNKRCVSCGKEIPVGYWKKIEIGPWEAQCDCGCLNWLWEYKGNKPVNNRREQ